MRVSIPRSKRARCLKAGDNCLLAASLAALRGGGDRLLTYTHLIAEGSGGNWGSADIFGQAWRCRVLGGGVTTILFSEGGLHGVLARDDAGLLSVGA